jgi:hypothetical protein
MLALRDCAAVHFPAQDRGPGVAQVFNPSRDDVRRFFCDAWRKHLAGEVVTPIESTALACIRLHPEYQALLGDPERALAEDYTVERGVANPFLHLSMHLALAEQLSIDQPAGIAAVVQRIESRTGDRHRALHDAMECLGETLWRVQRGSLGPDIAEINAAYMECLQRRARG